MKYCSRCGKELFDEAVICVDCGNVLSTDYEKKYKTGTNKSKRKTPFIVALIAVLVIAAVVGGFFVWRHIRTQNVIEELSGNTYQYFDEQYYSLLGKYSYEEKRFSFDREGVLTYSYYFSNIDSGDEYTRDYTIKFEGDRVFLICGFEETEYELQYDKYGNIESLYDVGMKELYQ